MMSLFKLVTLNGFCYSDRLQFSTNITKVTVKMTKTLSCDSLLALLILFPLVKTQNCSSDLIKLMKSAIPPMEGKSKGEAGKIGIIGGSIEYTGAPYFAATSALKVGADLVYVITTANAAPVIKSYSPDLIVYPFLNIDQLNKISSLITKMDVVVIGPGLGKSFQTVELTHKIITTCKDLKKPLVIDADGIYAVSKKISVLNEYPSPGVILTPNYREADYLLEAIKCQNSTWGNYITVLVKGKLDKYYSSNLDSLKWTLSGGGSGRRAAGQGDILSGTLGTLFNWALKANLGNCSQHTPNPSSIATYSAAKFTRLCNYFGYSKLGRSLAASDMLKEIHPAFEELFGK